MGTLTLLVESTILERNLAVHTLSTILVEIKVPERYVFVKTTGHLVLRHNHESFICN